MSNNKDLFKREKFDPSKQETLVSFETSTVWKDLKQAFRKNKAALIGLFLLVIVLMMAIIVPLTFKNEWATKPTSNTNMLPGFRDTTTGHLYLFGTDKLGRDLWARVWYGLRTSIFLASVATVINVSTGTFLGLMMGSQDSADKTLMVLVKIFSSIPIVLILILFSVTFGASLPVMLFSLIITGWISPSQQVRADVKINKKLDFMVASKVLGTKNYKIVWTFFLLSIPTIINQFIIVFPKMILFEATLGFLGLAEPDIPILGNVINDGRTQIFNYSYQLLIPVSFLVVTTVVMQLVSSAIQDAFKMGVSE